MRWTPYGYALLKKEFHDKFTIYDQYADQYQQMKSSMLKFMTTAFLDLKNVSSNINFLLLATFNRQVPLSADHHQ